MPERIWFIYIDNEDQSKTHFNLIITSACTCKQTWREKGIRYVYQKQNDLLEDQCQGNLLAP